jgi:hypothetical protein
MFLRGLCMPQSAMDGDATQNALRPAVSRSLLRRLFVCDSATCRKAMSHESAAVRFLKASDRHISRLGSFLAERESQDGSSLGSARAR